MLNLIVNENMKIFRRMRSWLFMASLIVITTIALFIVQQNIHSSPSANPQADVPLNQYRLDHPIPPTEETVWGNTLTAANFIIIVTVFTVIAAADSVAGEFSSGSIKMLLIRPVSRTKIWISKYLSTLLFSLVLLTVLGITAFLVSGMMVGFEDAGIPYLYVGQDGSVHEASMVHHVLATYGYQSISLLMIVTLAFMISTVFRSSSLAIGCSLGIMFIGSTVAHLLSSYSWAKYFLFLNTDLTVYVSGTPAIPGMTLAFSITVLAVYYVIFVASSLIVFHRRDVAS